MLASIGVGGISSAAMQSPIVSTQPVSAGKYATIQADRQIQIQFDRMMSSGVVGIENHRASWRKLNQRQIRKNRRRAHAAGKRNAF
jgi:hypothetical protein